MTTKPPDQPWPPTFRVQTFARGDQTDVQWACVLADQRRHAEAKGIYLGLFQQLATHQGFARACPLGRCRRLKTCSGRRAEDDWSFPFRPFIPPCVPLDVAVVEAMRAEIRAETARILARLAAREAASCQRRPEE